MEGEQDNTVCSWHGDEELHQHLRNFHDSVGRFPKKETDEAREYHTQLTKKLEDELKKRNKCSRVEFTGSSYEGVKVSNNIEFDVMMILSVSHTDVKVEPTKHAGYFHLRASKENASKKNANKENASKETPYKENPKLKKMLADKNLVSPTKAAGAFYGNVNRYVSKTEEARQRIKLKRHGPATQLEVYKHSFEDKDPWYFVDVVPAIEVTNGNTHSIYVAKSKLGDEMSWRISYSLEEKEKLVDIDRDNGCRKQVLRILKALLNREAGLQKLTSYHMKTALLHEVDAVDDVDSWRPSKLVPRVIGVLRRLYRMAKQEHFPHYFDPEINLLDEIPNPSTVTNIRDRFLRLLRSKERFMRALQYRKVAVPIE